MLFTVADSVMAVVSIGAAGLHVTLVTVRSGFGAGVPYTSSSATWPDGAPLLELNRSCTSAVVAASALAGTNVNVEPVAVTGLFSATLVPGLPVPVRVTVLLSPDTLPAPSRARTKYETVTLVGWVSANVVPVPFVFVARDPLR